MFAGQARPVRQAEEALEIDEEVSVTEEEVASAEKKKQNNKQRNVCWQGRLAMLALYSIVLIII